MKKLLLILAIGGMIGLVSCNTNDVQIPAAQQGYTYLTWNKYSNYKIVIGKNADKAEVTAAKELQKYIKKISGADLGIYKDNKLKESTNEIIIGKTNREKADTYTIDRDSLGSDGFNIKCINNTLVIAGGSPRGTLYGVFDFLEELGCGFFSVDSEIIPKTDDILLNLSTDITEKPAFEYRDLFWYCAYNEVLSAKLRLNGSLQSGENGRILTENYGNGIEYAGPMFVHTFNQLVPVDEYYDSHPEYFAEIKGKRIKDTSYQLCLTNEEVLQITIDKVKKWLRDNPNAKIVSVSQNDSGVIESYCTCSKCRSINIKEEKSWSGTLIRFVNTVADSIKDEFPDVAVDTICYQFSIKPPVLTKPRDNVIIRYCTGGCSAHPYGECSQSLGVKNDIENWAKISNRIYIWDYTTFFSQYLCPYVNINTFQPNIKFFYNNNVKGVFAQGNYQKGENGEFGELKCYLIAKLLWDPDTDIEKHKKDFLEGYYGSASTEINEYLDFLNLTLEKSGKHFNWGSNDIVDLLKGVSDNELKHLDSLWETANMNVSGNSVHSEHVKRSELSYRFYKLLSHRGEFSDTDNYDSIVSLFYKDCRSLGIVQYSEFAVIPQD